MEESGQNRLRVIHKYVWIEWWRVRALHEARLTKAYLPAFVVGEKSCIVQLHTCSHVNAACETPAGSSISSPRQKRFPSDARPNKER